MSCQDHIVEQEVYLCFLLDERSAIQPGVVMRLCLTAHLDTACEIPGGVELVELEIP